MAIPVSSFGNFRREFEERKRKEQARPVVRYLKETLNSLKTLPTNLLTAMAEAWAKGIIHGVPGG